MFETFETVPLMAKPRTKFVVSRTVSRMRVWMLSPLWLVARMAWGRVVAAPRDTAKTSLERGRKRKVEVCDVNVTGSETEKGFWLKLEVP